MAREVLDGIKTQLSAHYEGIAYADDIPEGQDWEVPEDYERHFCHEDGEDWPCPTVTAAPVTVARLIAALEAVLNLHASRTDGSDEPYCRHCNQAPYGHAPYPCPTVAAIENALKAEP